MHSGTNEPEEAQSVDRYSSVFVDDGGKYETKLAFEGKTHFRHSDNDDLYMDENSGVFTKVTKTATKYDEIFIDDIRNKLSF